jgi:SAM-dependent methyltransferase
MSSAMIRSSEAPRSGLAVRPQPGRYFLERSLFQAIAALAPGRRILNLGCGTRGRYRDALAAHSVVGVDLATPVEPQPWPYYQVDAASLPFDDESFDVVVSVEAFEHVKANQSAMREALRVLRPGGTLIVTVPTHWTWIFEWGHHGPHYYTCGDLTELVRSAKGEVLSVKSCGGAATFAGNWLKSWISPVGLALLGQRWWPLADAVFAPWFLLAAVLDSALRVLPSNWILIGRRLPGR